MAENLKLFHSVYSLAGGKARACSPFAAVSLISGSVRARALQVVGGRREKK